ncbi:hypothetical protein CPB83DRAFT_857597 [Crepidotus variabilis]|uniref:Protein kinase domain-containing protein n=1 Tax=Crepidotus variabilis TaxID=179855 RepID=A0A9P6JNH4_9AGAR|nr:hypothetical protein CPB83DRAFT_857597 [Crepidotus variabilis]
MLVSTPTKAFDPAMSPKYHHHRRHYTPPSRGSNSPYDSPMLGSPSPLRGRPLFPLSTNLPDSDDMPQFSYKSPPQASSPNPFYASKPQAIPLDDEEGRIFLSSGSSVFGGASSSQPLLTPRKQAKRIPSRSTLSANLAAVSAAPVSRGTGIKRKSTPNNATPLRPNTLTPLKLTKSNDNGNVISFDRLAPIAALNFNHSTKTPQSKAETEAYLTRQTATLTRLHLSEPDAFDFNAAADDSGVDMDDDSIHTPSPTKRKHVEKVASQTNTLPFDKVGKGKEKEEVAEAISPGGHINKRRARSRPVSAELRETAFKSPKRSPLKQNIKPSAIPCRVGGNRPRHSAPIAFPTTTNRGRGSPGSSTEGGSPRPRRRVSATARPSHLPPLLPRPQLERIESGSLFFGPANPQTAAPSTRSRTSTFHPSATPAIPRTSTISRPQLSNRHSYTGPGTSSSSTSQWNTVQTRDVSPSPGSSPFSLGHKSKSGNNSMDWDDEDSFFTANERSVDFKLVTHSPSPTSKAALPKKFKARNSLSLSDDDDFPPSSVPDLLRAGPQASTSLSSMSDDGLVTPVCGPDSGSGWPSVFVGSSDASPEVSGIDIDEFIQKTLADASKASVMPKKAPGTPVKKGRVSFFGERPWQSAVASKVGLRDDCEFKKMPRKSLPAAFPTLKTVAGPKTAKLPKIASMDWQPTDTEDDEEYSPSTRRGDRYTGLGLGQPTSSQTLVNDSSMSSIIRSRWPVIRRSSSGAFSSGSDASLANTPTRTTKGIDWQLPKPRIPLRFSPSSDALRTTSRSTSGSSSSSIIYSPTISRTAGGSDANPLATATHARLPRPSLNNARRFSDTYAEEEKPGRFERDFDEIEQVGSGEFGQVLKVRSKNGDGEVFAVKKSKQFEGAKHRLRLREEVDILKHLSQAALSQSFSHGRHPNVLGYTDSWEEAEALYIRTELCESGNLARFLWEYGRVFPRLDEARVWKIIADLSSGLRFIHDSGVIHLDLKPSNVFVTKEGRFKIGDFGMASLWPRPVVDGSAGSTAESAELAVSRGGFEREGDKLYLAPEVLQGRYSKAADVFSFGMTILETATNIVVPDQGEAWHRLRNEDFSQVDLDDDSDKLVKLIQQMMRRDPSLRLTIAEVWSHPPVRRARERMETKRAELASQGKSLWGSSPLASVPSDFLDDILDMSMDTSL